MPGVIVMDEVNRKFQTWYHRKCNVREFQTSMQDAYRAGYAQRELETQRYEEKPIRKKKCKELLEKMRIAIRKSNWAIDDFCKVYSEIHDE